jgi:hypothetical protein
MDRALGGILKDKHYYGKKRTASSNGTWYAHTMDAATIADWAVQRRFL